MRSVLMTLLTILFIHLNSFGQTFSDVASQHNIASIPTAAEYTGIGMSFYDFDEDGWDDLTLPINNDSILFYRNNNGAFEKIDSYIVSDGVVREILWVDYDNDLDLDICISYDDVGFRLYQNDGAFQFSDQTASAGISTAPFKGYGFAFADPDNDGDLDFYLASHEVPIQFANPQVNFYYENQGNGTFIEKAQMLGIDNGAAPTFMPVWFDYNNDNHLDLAVINDKNLWNDALYQNSGSGTFQDMAATLGFSNNGHNPMSLSIADFNNDGYQDVFKTDLGNDLIHQGAPFDHKLYKNEAGLGFTEIAQGSGLDTNLFGWGAVWVDYNNDSFEDLFFTTSLGFGSESLLFRNNSGTSFELMNDSISGNLVHTSYCAVKGDMNNDGFYDIVVLNHQDVPNLLLNSGNNNHFIKLDLVGHYSNQKAIGAKIEVFANNEHQTQVVFCGTNLCAQDSQHKIFGLGSSTVADSVIVTFPSGIIMREYNLAADSSYTIHEQVMEYVDLNQGVDTVYACPGDQFTIGIEGYENYEWSTGSQDSLIVVQYSGWYSFEATNQEMDTLFVSNPVFYSFELPLAIVENVIDPGCGQAIDGAVNLTLTPIQFVDSVDWSTGDSGANISGVPAGTYSYTVTTNYSCIYSGSVTLQSTPVFTTQTMTELHSDVSFGSATFFMWGGVAPYALILDGDTVSNPIENLTYGNYEVIITDAVGCSDTIDFVILNNTSASLTSANPSSMSVTLENGNLRIISPLMSEVQRIELFNLMGAKIVDSNTWVYDADTQSAMRNIEGLANGMYQVVLTFENVQVSLSVSIF
ncbi:MAG: CRTAC1 family protein [bacterium]|nr:CRTAC1 family protein [bacterium]